MGKRKRKPRGASPRPDCPEVLGAAWQSQMIESCESLAALVWKRVWVRFRIDLSHRRVDPLQVYELLLPLRGRDPVTAEMLAEVIDANVRRLFAA